MNKTFLTILVIIVLIAAAVGIGWLYFRANPEAWANLQAELAGEQTSSAPKPAQKTTRRTGGLVASGAIEAEEITVSTDLGGRVTETAADEGNSVTAGQMLLQLDRATLLAEQAGAAAAVVQA
ncbi:MAG: biotin/lipoyl-binding protein, partial [Anaerolineales bacterium]|nr:biotin/lipoyl-binding protein [Anaerolineales bacterium]